MFKALAGVGGKCPNALMESKIVNYVKAELKIAPQEKATEVQPGMPTPKVAESLGISLGAA